MLYSTPYYLQLASLNNGLLNIVRVNIKPEFLTQEKYKKLEQQINNIMQQENFESWLVSSSDPFFSRDRTYFFNNHVYQNKRTIECLEKQLKAIDKNDYTITSADIIRFPLAREYNNYVKSKIQQLAGDYIEISAAVAKLRSVIPFVGAFEKDKRRNERRKIKINSILEKLGLTISKKNKNRI